MVQGVRAAPRRAGEACAGFGLVEVLLAIVIMSVGILGASTVVLGIASQGRRAMWNTDQALAGRSAADSLMGADFASVVSGSGTGACGGRQCDVSYDVTVLSTRLKLVRLEATLASAPGTVLETIVSRPRPLPGAP